MALPYCNSYLCDFKWLFRIYVRESSLRYQTECRAIIQMSWFCWMQIVGWQGASQWETIDVSLKKSMLWDWFRYSKKAQVFSPVKSHHHLIYQ